MNIISSIKFLLITQAIHFSEQMKHKKDSISIDICKGNDVDLLWKVDEEEYKISKLEWYFNNKMICTSSPLEIFTVNTPYQGRIERIGKTEIRLKNVSIDDEGIYILFPLLTWSTSQNMQKIVLRILGTTLLSKRLKKTVVPSLFIWTKETAPESLSSQNHAFKRSAQRNSIQEVSDKRLHYCSELDINFNRDVTEIVVDNDTDIADELVAEKLQPKFTSSEMQTPKQPVFSFEKDDAGVYFCTGLQAFECFQFVLCTLGTAAYSLNYVHH